MTDHLTSTTATTAGSPPSQSVRRETWDRRGAVQLDHAGGGPRMPGRGTGPGRAALGWPADPAMTCRMSTRRRASGSTSSTPGIQAARARERISPRRSPSSSWTRGVIPFPDESFDTISATTHEPPPGEGRRPCGLVSRAPARRPRALHGSETGRSPTRRCAFGLHVGFFCSRRSGKRASPCRGRLRHTRGAGRDRGDRVDLAEVAGRPCAEARGARPRRRR